ncbi:VWA domain-containing protein [Candidatus Woesearchaeota archaeon]|nr:VWA domain-containing protein [Candidatus Woesearchaeota archaeon]
MVILLFTLLIINFVKYEKEEKRGVWKYRVWLFLSRLLILGLLVFALASPYVIKKETTDGNPEINLLYDNSSSMALYELDHEGLRDKLQAKVPTNMRMMAAGTTSMLGDEIFRELHKKNILIITDGNNDPKSMDFRDVVTFAKKFNTTINAVKLEENFQDASISINGPYTSIINTEFVFNVNIINAKVPVNVKIVVAGKVVFDKETDEEQIEIKHRFDQLGQFRIIAEITSTDQYAINNKYYHVVEIVKKPKVLYVSDSTSYIDNILNARYEVSKTSAVPNDLSNFYSVVINDKMDSITDQQSQVLETFTDEGNGMIVVGGEKSFLTSSNIDLLLPVKRGHMEAVGVDFNFVILVDGSGYISEKMTREELIANDILNSLLYRKEKINVAIVSFAHVGEVVSDWKLIKDKDELAKDMLNHDDVSEIDGVKWYRPASLHLGLRKADEILKGKQGNNNVIVITDGAIFDATFKKSIESMKSMRNKGTRIHSYNLVNKQFDDTALKKSRQSISSYGRGMFVKNPQDVENLFEKNLIISNANHWITQGLSLSGGLFRYNSVVPTAAADVLVTTGTGTPIVSVNNYNKVGVISTDDGTEWSQEMYTPQNIFLVYRLMDWGVGDPNRKRESYVRVTNAIVNHETKVEYKGSTAPGNSECNFYSVEDHYECMVIPKEIGFGKIKGKEFGVNYDPEYKYIGYNNNAVELLVLETGGNIFSIKDIDGMVEKAKDKAKVELLNKKYVDWYLTIAAMVLFLIEILIRRIKEKIKSRG